MPGEREGRDQQDATLAATGLYAATEVATTPSGQVIAGRYEVLGLLGAGGMGTVYKVHDRELDEIVALKTLRHGWIDAPGALDRFKREVRLARRVTHRNVARTFDIGEAGADKFLTMEYVDGASLGRTIQTRGPLAVGEAIGIASAIAEALEAAHAAGVIHRDLKPDNVLLARDGRIVVTDFGIACAEAPDAFTTATGSVIGTPAYMSPEQVEGSAVDLRSDLYALGLVLFEMLTARRAFAGDSPFALAAARLIQPPPDPGALRPDLPGALIDATLRLLARRAEDRPQDAAAVRSSLAAIDASTTRSVTPRSPALPPARGDVRSVALYPLRSVGPEADAWIADGFTDDLQDALCLIRGLRIKARSAAHDGDDPQAHGRRMGVDLVVDGSVRRHGEGVRIQLRMTGVADGFQIWARRYDAAIGDLLVLGEQAAGELASAAGSASVTSMTAPVRAGVDPEAIELYLRARIDTRSFSHSNPALELLDRALALAPREPRILAARAILGARDTFRPNVALDEMLGRARHNAERAVELGPELAEPWIALAHVRNACNDSPGAVRALKRALQNGPSVAEGYELAGRLLGEADRLEDAAKLLDHALWIDARLPFARIERVRNFALRSDHDATVRELAELRIFSPLHHAAVAPRYSVWSGRVLHDRAPLPKEMAEFGRFYAAHACLLAETGTLSAEALRTLEATVARAPLVSRPRRFFEQLLCEILATLGADGALDSLERAVSAGLEDLAWIERCPAIASIRSDPRFAAQRELVRARAMAVVRAWEDP